MADLTVTDKSVQADVTESRGLGERLLGLYNRGGVVKAYRITYVNDSGGALADGSIVQLCTVPAGIILPHSFITTSAFGAARTLDMGTQEYIDTNGDTVASDIDALFDGLDVSAALTNKEVGTDTNSLAKGDGLIVTGQVDILAKVIGGTLPVSGTIEGFIFMITA